jgi:hypothetical protein
MAAHGLAESRQKSSGDARIFPIYTQGALHSLDGMKNALEMVLLKPKFTSCYRSRDRRREYPQIGCSSSLFPLSPHKVPSFSFPECPVRALVKTAFFPSPRNPIPCFSFYYLATGV